MATVVNINDVLDDHVALEVDCVDRLFLNAYVPKLQVGGQVVRFLTEHLGNQIPSPALFDKIGNRFRRDVRRFAQEQTIPVLHLKKPDRSRWDDRKLDHVRPYLQSGLGGTGSGGSSSDNDGTVFHRQTGRVRQARRKGVRVQNQWWNPLNHLAGSDLVDLGRTGVHAHFGGRLRPSDVMADVEATAKACGVTVARLQGKSWAPTPSHG